MRMNWSVQFVESNVCTVCLQRVSDSFALQEGISYGIPLVIFQDIDIFAVHLLDLSSCESIATSLPSLRM